MNTSTRLSDLAQGRDNNLNLIRILAAYAVLVSHSVALATGNPQLEPLRQTLGMTPGDMAVDVFFIASGFLVTLSLLSRQSAIEFFWSRVLRIFPGLLVMLLITVFGIGLAVTQHSAASYLSDTQTYRYFLKCLTLVRDVEYILPGVFDDTPLPRAVNGSLWTLPQEVKMYVVLLSLWLVAAMVSARTRVFALAVLVGAIASAAALVAWRLVDPTQVSHEARLFFFFFVGGAFAIVRERISLTGSIFWPLLLVLLASTTSKTLFFFVYCFSLPYLLFFVAYRPGGFIRRYNLAGDYSYGIYIYAYPIQQTIAVAFVGISVTGMLITSSVLTLLLAVASWHGVEKPTMAWRHGVVDWHRSLLRRVRSGAARPDLGASPTGQPTESPPLGP